MNKTIETLKDVCETVPTLYWPATPGQIKLNNSRRRLLDELIEQEEKIFVEDMQIAIDDFDLIEYLNECTVEQIKGNLKAMKKAIKKLEA